MLLRNRLQRVAARRLRAACMGAMLVLPSAASIAAGGVDNWTGAGGESWANSSWSPAAPGTTDTVLFNDTASVTLPGITTSILDTNRTIGGLAFSDSYGRYHTLDLGGFALNVNGLLSFNTDSAASSTTVFHGSLNVGGISSNMYVGCAVTGGSIGSADLSGLTSFNATVNNLLVGSSSSGGANGTLTLSPTNVITANLIQVGAANNSGDANGTLHLGLSNTISTAEFDIGKDNGNATVNIVNGGMLILGASNARTVLQVGNDVTSSNTTYVANLNLANGDTHAFLSSLVIGQASNVAGFGGATGSFIAGTGTLDIGGPGNAGNVYIGNNLSTGGTAIGAADFSAMSSLTANVNNFDVAISTGAGVSGNIKLAINNTINANSMLIGARGGGNASFTFGTGATNILTGQFSVGQEGSNATATLPAGASLSIGSSANRAQLLVGSNDVGTNALPLAALNTAGGNLTAYLSNMTVGQDSGPGGAGGTTANFIAGTGSIDIGVPGNTSNILVGNNISGGGTAIGIVDFSSMSSLNANVNNLSIGTSLGGSAVGTMKLAASNTINATNITVGSSGGNSNSLVLGQSNTILVNQLTIGKDYSVGSVTIPAGGVLNLGSAAQPANLTIAVGTTNTNAVYGGSLDLTNATFNAYLGNVIIGNKDTLPGSEVGTLTISSNANNFIAANSIALGGNQSTGTINYGGGAFYANSITRGPGTANFNWTGGSLSVGTFGSPTATFNLNNAGSGNLAPGTTSGAIGATNIYGNYTQSAAASTTIRIAGDSPATGNDQVNISQTATLAGNLNLRLVNGAAPTTGENFLIETYGTRSGTYGYVSPPTLPQNVAFQLDYASNPNQLVVRMVNPTAQNFTSSASAATFGTAGNWNNNIAPSTFNADTINNAGSSPQTVTVGGSTTVHSVNLSGTGASLNFELLQGVTLGVAYQLNVGTNSTLRGGGHIDGNVVVSGGVVSPNGLLVSGNFTAQPDSTLLFSLATPSATSDLAVADTLTADGILDVTLSGYAPHVGDSFSLLNFGSITGRFDAINLPALSPGLAWDQSQLMSTGDITVVPTPEPAALGLLAAAGAMLGLRRRRR